MGDKNETKAEREARWAEEERIEEEKRRAALARIAPLLESVKAILAEATKIADEEDISFTIDITGDGYSDPTYNPGFGWSSSSC